MGSLEYHRDEHPVPLIVSHRMWCPKRWSTVVVNQIGRRCEDLIRSKGQEKGWTMLELAVQPDHSELYARVWPAVRAADVVKECTGVSAFTPRKEFPELLKLPSRWTRSYCASTAGTVRSETMQRSREAQSRP